MPRDVEAAAGRAGFLYSTDDLQSTVGSMARRASNWRAPDRRRRNRKVCRVASSWRGADDRLRQHFETIRREDLLGILPHKAQERVEGITRLFMGS